MSTGTISPSDHSGIGAPGDLFAGEQLLNRVHFGDCRASLRMLIDAGVKAQMCVTSPPYFGLRSYLPDDHADKHLELGLEQSPDEFIANLVDVFRLVRELLADDGTLWLNIGDTYASKPNGNLGVPKAGSVSPHVAVRTTNARRSSRLPEGFKHKDLIGIPWMLAFALRSDGWFLRQDIIWAKPNPMPESVTDRCTKSHEYLFLLSKSASYFYDQDAIKEPAALSSLARWSQNVDAQIGSDRVPGKTNGMMKAVGGARSKRDSFKRDGSKRAEVMPHQTMGTHRPDRAESTYDVDMRNKRSVWNVPTQPYAGAHFATFPPALIGPCILAGARHGDVVLDPFFGSGTTGQVAQDLGRQWIGCELNDAYEPLQQARTAQSVLFNEGAQ